MQKTILAIKNIFVYLNYYIRLKKSNFQLNSDFFCYTPQVDGVFAD